MLIFAASHSRRATPGLTRENEWTRNCAIVGAFVSLEHRHQPAQLDAVRVRLDLLRLGRKLLGHPRVVFLVAVGIGVMDRHVRVGDGGLFEIIVDAAAAALVAGLQLDRDPRAVVDVDPLDAVLLDQFVAQAVGRNLHALAPAVEDLRQVPLGVDLDFVVMGRIAAWRPST